MEDLLSAVVFSALSAAPRSAIFRGRSLPCEGIWQGKQLDRRRKKRKKQIPRRLEPPRNGNDERGLNGMTEVMPFPKQHEFEFLRSCVGSA